MIFEVALNVVLKSFIKSLILQGRFYFLDFSYLISIFPIEKSKKIGMIHGFEMSNGVCFNPFVRSSGFFTAFLINLATKLSKFQ